MIGTPSSRSPHTVATPSIRWRILKDNHEGTNESIRHGVATPSIRWRILKVSTYLTCGLGACVATPSIRWRILKVLASICRLWFSNLWRRDPLDPLEDTESDKFPTAARLIKERRDPLDPLEDTERVFMAGLTARPIVPVATPSIRWRILKA